MGCATLCYISLICAALYICVKPGRGLGGQKSGVFKAWALWAIAFQVNFSISVSVCVSICLFTFEVPFKCIFAPTSKIWMSKSFKDFKSFRKSNGKKLSQISKLLLMKGVKLLRKKVCFGVNFVLLSRIFLYWCFSLRLIVFWPPLPEIKCLIILDFRNPWVK